MSRMSLYVAIVCLVAIALPIGAQVCGTLGGGAIPGNYLSGTRKCSIGETVFLTTTACADDGGKEILFDQPLTVFQAAVAGGGWATWNVPPFAESPNPYVGFNNGNSELTLTYRKLQGAAGFEIEPNAFGAFSVTANYLDINGNLLASQTLMPNGSAGSLLFGGVCNTKAIKTVQITSDPAAAGFAISQLRGDNMPGFMDPPKETLVGPPIKPIPGMHSNTGRP